MIALLVGFPLFPPSASTLSDRVDALYFFAVAVSVFFSLLVAGLVVYFFARYKRRSADEVGVPNPGNLQLEILWSVVPLGIALVMFGWGADVFFDLSRPPADAVEYYAVGKQWMWKLQHVEGQARDQRAATYRWVRPIKLDDDIGGRHPQLLRAGVPHQIGTSCPGRFTTDVVRGDEDRRPTTSSVQRVLRHRARAA